MKITELRELCDATPFKPFFIELAGGRQIPVRHREFIMPAPSGRTVIVYQPDDSFDIVDVTLVTTLRVKKSSNGKAKGR